MEKVIDADVCNYNAIDIGLPSGLKWADRNVGAATPEDYGDYFMWGSVTPDTDKPCDWSHAPFNNGSNSYDAAYFASVSGDVCPNGILAPEYDAARVNMGGSWRMPTSADIQELLDGTDCTVEEVNGISGMRFTAPNGNSIFMPFAGYSNSSGVYLVGYGGYAWSSSLDAGGADYSHCIGFSDAGVDYRCGGFVVRGVCK